MRVYVKCSSLLLSSESHACKYMCQEFITSIYTYTSKVSLRQRASGGDMVDGLPPAATRTRYVLVCAVYNLVLRIHIYRYIYVLLERLLLTIVVITTMSMIGSYYYYDYFDMA